MFGGQQSAPPPPAAAAAPVNKNQTMMFGTPASNAVPPPAAPPPPAAKQTLVFGGNAPSFGTPQSRELDVLPEAPVEETIMDRPGQSARTMMFGTPAAPPEPAPSAKNQTMMFGRVPAAAIPKVTAGTVELAGYAADEGAPNESTVRVDVAQVIEEHGESNEAPPERHDRTQRFAMSDAGGTTPPEGQDSVQDRHNRTQLFAMSSRAEQTDPNATLLAEPSVFVGDATLPPNATPVLGDRPRLDLTATLPPGQPLIALESEDPAGVSVLHDPANMTPPEARQAQPESPVATTLPNLPVMDRERMAPLALEMAPEPGGSPMDLRAPISMSAQEDAAAMRAARGGGAGRAVVIILALVALVLLGVLVYRLFGPQLMSKATGAISVPSLNRFG
jgi:hypothetical protein